MGKKTPGTARQLDTGSDQDSLSGDESALMEQMRADGAAGDDEGGGEGGEDQGGEGGRSPAPAAGAKKADAEGGKAEGEGDNRGKTVPHGAFHEERESRKKAEAALTKALEDSAKERAEAERRMTVLLEKFAPKPDVPKPEVAPDRDEDPAGWIAWKMEQDGKSLAEVRTELAELKKKGAEQTDIEKRQGAVRIVTDYAISKEREFMAKTPDYNDASAFLIASRKDELADLGWDDQQIEQIINQERFAIATRSKEQGKNPAEIVYNIAKKRGFKPKAAEGAGGEGGGEGGKQLTTEERLTNTRNGQDQSRSLSAAPGQGPSPMTAKRLMEMSEAEFDNFSTKNPAEFRRLMGQ